jgi:branched-chain amino acid aminotransferase
MLDIHGNLSESNAHNFFLVLNNNLCTPTDKNVLGGITKDVLISIAQENKIEVVEGDFTPYDLYNADEAFLSSTSPTIVPIQSVNGLKIGKQVPGPVTKLLTKAWSQMVGVDIVVQALAQLAPDEAKSLLKMWENARAA